jgi:hypothetical protein
MTGAGPLHVGALVGKIAGSHCLESGNTGAADLPDQSLGIHPAATGLRVIMFTVGVEIKDHLK